MIKNIKYSTFALQFNFNKSTMPKAKTNSGAKKRFKLTGTGKIKRKHAFHSHILTKKSKKRKRKLSSSGLVSKQDEKAIKRLLRVE